MAGRTPSGAPTAAERAKHGEKDGSFPIWDHKSAIAALKLRGHASSQKEKDDIIRRAKKYAPEEAKAAWIEDHPSA